MTTRPHLSSSTDWNGFLIEKQDEDVELMDGNGIPVIFHVAALPVHASHFPRDHFGSIQLQLPCRGIPIAA
ncbi:hypothetical protein DUI87_15517 [Hirundo rustica rustica]|uniref:Uncharacterized protein n=1 Tax=Hirundo rustica rustica TaxID=333673 RepID=A0A3M0K9N8_HIRRU|nr:hypothetical protein DUI87_15517 [Hirundo rustica rustica]